MPPPDFPNTICAAHQGPPEGIAPCGCLIRKPVPDHPKEIPFNLTNDNQEPLGKWLLNHYASSAFNVCTHQPLQEIAGKPMNLTFRPDAEATAVHTPIPVQHKKEVKAALDSDVALGIIEPVPPGVPSVWCSQMVVVPKKDGSPRRTVDYQKLNQSTLRETHHTPTPFNQMSTIPPNIKKTVLDALNGYHIIPLSPQARDATIFIIEWGRFRYLRAHMGLHTSGDIYTRSYDDIR